MPSIRILFLLAAVAAVLCGGMRAQAQSPSPASASPTPRAEPAIISKEWVDAGYKSCKPEEADFTVNVSYKVPGVIDKTDSFSFHKAWEEMTNYADGTSGVLVTGGLGIEGVCRDGVDDRWCNGMPYVYASGDGLHVSLSLAWGKHGTGKSEQVKREFVVPWSELEKTVKDERLEMRVAVRWKKP